MKRFYGSIFLSIAFALAGTSVISARLVTGKLGSFSITAISLLFAVFGLLPVCRKSLITTVKSMNLGKWISICVQALFGIFLFRMFLLNGLTRTSTGEAGILTGATPAITAILAFLFLRERMHCMRVMGLASTIAGIILIQGSILSGNVMDTRHFIGNVLVLLASSCESIFNILSRVSMLKTTADESVEINPIVRTLLVSFAAFLFCIIPAIFEHFNESLFTLGLIKWLALAWYGFIVTALAFIFWYMGIKRCEASTAAVFSGLMPLTSFVLSVVLLGEQPGLPQYLGGFMILLGTLLNSLPKGIGTSN